MEKQVPVVSFTSDFGIQDGYVGIVKGVIQSINDKAKVIDLSHQIEPYDVNSAAWIIFNAYKYFPLGSVHLVVVDPKVGSSQRRLLLSTGAHHFIGPDSGVFSYIIKTSTKGLRAFELNNKELFLENVSSSFHARDIFGPVAAHISKGVALDKVGNQIEVSSLDTSIYKEPITRENEVVGEVIYCDRFGNLITNIVNSLVPNKPSNLIDCLIARHKISSISTTYASVSKGELLFLKGSHGFLEIASNQDNAMNLTKSKVGDEVTLSWS